MKSIRQSIILPELVVHEQHTVQLKLAQPAAILIAKPLMLCFRCFPRLLHLLLAESTEADTPTLKDDDLDSWLVFRVDHFPLRLGSTISSSCEGGFVVAWNLDITFTVSQSPE